MTLVSIAYLRQAWTRIQMLVPHIQKQANFPSIACSQIAPLYKKKVINTNIKDLDVTLLKRRNQKNNVQRGTTRSSKLHFYTYLDIYK